MTGHDAPDGQFLLGTHQPGWLRTAGVPLLVSDRRLPAAEVPWALDSGGFTELQKYARKRHKRPA